MGTPISLNSVSYNIPALGEDNWGTDVANYLIALSTGVLAKSGGTFTLTGDADFGTGFGLKSIYYKSRGTVSSAGVVRLANAESVGWRNAANGADLLLKVNSSDILEFGGNPIPTIALGAADTVLQMNAGGTAFEFALLNNANVASAAAIAVNKLAALTASRAVALDGSGFLVAATTTATELGYVNGVTSAIQTQLNTKITASSSDTLTNKTIDGDNNTVQDLPETAIKTNLSNASKFFTRDASGIPESATKAVPSGTVVGTSDSQTLTNKVLSGNTAVTLISGSGTLTLNTTGTITVPNATDTLVGKATTDTLTNKTISGNTAANLISGSGTLTLNTSGTITVPNGTDTLVEDYH